MIICDKCNAVVTDAMVRSVKVDGLPRPFDMCGRCYSIYVNRKQELIGNLEGFKAAKMSEFMNEWVSIVEKPIDRILAAKEQNKALSLASMEMAKGV